MATANPYSVPWLKMKFISPYPVIQHLGFHNFVPLAAVWRDVQQGETIRTMAGGQTAAPILFQVRNIPDPNGTTGGVANPVDTFCKVGFGKLFKPNLPALVLERNTGAVLLRPEPVLQSTSLDDTMTWTSARGRDVATETGFNIQGRSGIPGQDGMDWSWVALDSTEKKDVFSERNLLPSPQGPEGGALPEADDDGSPIHCINYIHKPTASGAAGHCIKSNFELPESPSFYIAVQVPSAGITQDQTAPTVWVNFGTDYAIGFSAQGVVFSDTSGGGGGKTEGRSVSGITKGPFLQDPGNGNQWYFVLVQTVRNAIVLQNAWEQIGDDNRDEPSKGWAYFKTFSSYTGDLGAQTTPSEFKVESANMYVTFSAANSSFCFFPCHRVKHGVIEMVTAQPMGYTPDVLNVIPGMSPRLNWQQSPAPSGDIATDTPTFVDNPPTTPANGNNVGFITTIVDKTSVTDAYTWSSKFEIKDTQRTDRSPELYTLAIDASPAYANATFNFFSDNDHYVPQSRILRASIQLGVVDQSAEITLSNRDGMFNGIIGTNKMDGVYPVQIECGWNRADGTADSTQKGIRITGFCYDPGYAKKPDMSTVTLKIEGRKAQLEEAQAVNLPIYDGYTHVKVIKDLLNRGGYKYYDTKLCADISDEVNNGYLPSSKTQLTAIDDTFQLPMTLQGQSPNYNFTMGTSIWQCIQQVASTTAFWTFFDNKGVLHYVNPFKSTTAEQTFREVASDQITSYDECYALTSTKETANIRNAVMVIGLDYRYILPNPIVGLKKDDGTHGTDPLTTTTGLGYIPWYRWAFINDGKLDTPEVVEWMANRVYQNSKNPRVTARFRTWGKPTLFPLDMVKFNINKTTGAFADHATGKNPVTNNIDLRADDSLFRILTITDSFDFEKGSYWTDFEVEFFDTAWGWASWWDPATPNG